MISLLSLTKYTDSDLLSARWLDDAYGIKFEFNAVHHSDGRPLARTEDCPAPVLTAEQLSQAQPFQEPALTQHPAYELANLGIEKKPEWKARYEKAARLVEEGKVRLTGPETAVVKGDTDTYDVTGTGTSSRCRCSWAKHKSEPCAHVMATRMARALGQAIESPMAHGMKRTIDVDTMWTNIYRQHNREQLRRRRNRYDRHSRTRRQTAVVGAGGD
jgi:hypothetical protein